MRKTLQVSEDIYDRVMQFKNGKSVDETISMLLDSHTRIMNKVNGKDSTNWKAIALDLAVLNQLYFQYRAILAEKQRESDADAWHRMEDLLDNFAFFVGYVGPISQHSTLILKTLKNPYGVADNFSVVFDDLIGQREDWLLGYALMAQSMKVNKGMPDSVLMERLEYVTKLSKAEGIKGIVSVCKEFPELTKMLGQERTPTTPEET